MSVATEAASHSSTEEQEFATFYLGDLLTGVDIRQIQEIDRHLELTAIPHAPPWVRGVTNLRGEVVTVLDLRMVAQLETSEITEQSRNVIVDSQGEQIGLLVDRVADVVTVRTDEIEPPPANIGGIDSRFFRGVYKLNSELLVLLNVEEALAVDDKHGQ